MRPRILLAISATVAGLGIVLAVGQPGQAQEAGGRALKVTHTQNTTALPAYEVFEITFQHDETYGNPFLDVRIDVTFTSPTGKQMKVGGFHYGSLEKPEIRVTPQGDRRRVDYIFSKANIWKARFAPSELGRWTFSYVFSNVRGESAAGKGEFACVQGKKHNPGFVRQNPDNPFRWIFDDGTPYFPIGLQDGAGDHWGTGSCLSGRSLEGPFRKDPPYQLALPAGPLFVRGPGNNPQNADVYYRRYTQCGFNLARISQRNGFPPLYRDRDHYLVQEAIMMDESLCYFRKYGLHVYYGIFGVDTAGALAYSPDDLPGMEKVKRFVKYTVDRWGAYVDFWEFFNEQRADDRWFAIMIPYLQSVDPYHHPISTSGPRPDLPGIEINAPHRYWQVLPLREAELNCDRWVAGAAQSAKKYGKPIIVGEEGNSIPGMITFQQSLRNLPSFMQELKDQVASNEPSVGKQIWAQMKKADRDTLMQWDPKEPKKTDLENFLIWSLRPILDKKNFYDEKAFQGVHLSARTQELLNQGIDNLTRHQLHELNRRLIEDAYPDYVIKYQDIIPPGVGGVWDPASALRMRLRIWTYFFNEVAIVFWNTSYARDGHWENIWLGPREREYIRALQDFAYRLDKDIRMVPVQVSEPNLVRASGLASSERAAIYLHHFKDHENPVQGLKVTLDIPKAAQGYWYSPENAEILGVFDAPAGKGDLQVPPFTVDIALLITPDQAPDIDQDGIPNNLDPDDDNDGVPDVKDAFPLEPEEWADQDGDLIGDNMDADKDADGVGDDDNRNGIPDHEEMDLDGDGVARTKAVPWDAFPLDPKEWRDTDGDGIGDNADTDDDGDGWSDLEEQKAGTDPLDKLSFPLK